MGDWPLGDDHIRSLTRDCGGRMGQVLDTRGARVVPEQGDPILIASELADVLLQSDQIT